MKSGHYVVLSFLVIAMFVISGCTNDLEATGAAQGGKGGKGSTECNDKKDNDGDGQCDHHGCTQGKGRNNITLPADSDCSSTDDNSESPGCTPTAEVCDGVDNDCDGSVDEDLTQACGSDVGECAAGAQTCSGGAWGSCVGEVGPSVEVCNNLDNDCDGVVDNGCVQ